MTGPQSNSSLRILVTGSVGFIGRNLVPKLVELGHEVWSLERYVTGRTNLFPNTIYADLRDGYAIRKAVRQANPHVIIHLAAFSPVSYSYDRPQEVVENNLLGTINLAEEALRDLHGLTQFIFASTSETYGNNGKKEQDEGSPLQPESPYAVSKVACENYIQYLGRAYDFPYTIMKPFNTYGRLNDTHFLVESAITQMLNGKELWLGDPNPIRDWLYVDDHVDAYLRAAGNEKALGNAINVCLGRGYSIKETVEKIAKIVKFHGEIRWNSIPARPNESKIIVGNNTKARELIGWSPKYSLDQGLEITVRKWRDKLGK